MAELNTNTGNGKRKKGQASRMNLRVDFTPMVDMNMLLITFFMFCTTLSTPQVMDIVMPAKTTEYTEPPETIASRTVTLLLGKDSKVYYYWGIPDYESANTLKEASLANNSLRDILLEKNAHITQQARDLKIKRAKKEISEDQFKAEMSALRKSKEGITVILKPTDKSTYSDLVRTLDEMQICSVGKYAIVDPVEGDNYLLEKYSDHNTLAQVAN